MKAIFAVSALAAAISAQALAADTEIDTTVTGSVDVYFAYDLANDPAQGDVDLVEDGDDGEGNEVDMLFTVTNGPFHAGLSVELYDSEYYDGPRLDYDSLYVETGNLTFGMIGNLTTTDEYAGDMTEAGEVSSGDVDLIGFRYAVMDGFTVQLHGGNATITEVDEDGENTGLAVEGIQPSYNDLANEVYTAYGAAAQYTGSADALSYTVEASFLLSDFVADLSDDADPQLFVGAGADYALDAVTLTAAFNFWNGEASLVDFSRESYTEYVVGAAGSAAGLGYSLFFTGFSDEALSGGSEFIVDADVDYTAGAITVGGGYYFTSAEETGDELDAFATYAIADNWDATATVTMSEFDADPSQSPYIELDTVYTTEDGVELYAGMDFQAEGDANGETTIVFTGARYSF